MPRFSIVIPTRQRADTLGFTLRTALAQTHTDFEVVVQNNGNDAATNAVVAAFASPRIVLRASDTILPMAENWEAALTACSGEHVAFIGDDDGIMPDACAICAAVLASRPALGALHWVPHYYDWPSSLRIPARNRLVVNLPGPTAGTIVRSRDLLLRIYDGSLSWTSMPLIYNGCFVRRSVIETVREFSGGRYFAGPIPDVHSGIANLWAMPQFLHIDRPLSVCGASGHSNGTAHFVGGGGAPLQRRFHVENPMLHRQVAEYFLDSTNMELTVASALVFAKSLFFCDDADIVLDMRNLLLRMGSGANRDPSHYDQTIAHMRHVAQKCGIDVSDLKLPPRQAVAEASFQGPVSDASGRTTCVAVNGAQAGIVTIADAVRLATSMLPVQSPAQLDAALPRLEALAEISARIAGVMATLAPLLTVQPRDDAVARYFRLTADVVATRRGDATVQCALYPALTTSLSLCRISIAPHKRPLALFIPGMLGWLPDAALRALPLLHQFNLAIVEWPAHGASGETGDASLAGIAAAFVALVDQIIPSGDAIFAIGEALGGLLALALARLRPQQIRNVILLDTPFDLTRSRLVRNAMSCRHASGLSSCLHDMTKEIAGCDPDLPDAAAAPRYFDLLQDAPFNCALIPGSIQSQHEAPSVLSDADLDAARAIHPALLLTPRVARAGHHLLRDDPQGTMAAVNALLVRA